MTTLIALRLGKERFSKLEPLSAASFEAKGCVDGSEWMANHVHLLTGLKPVHSVAGFLKIVKSKLTKWFDEKQVSGNRACLLLT